MVRRILFFILFVPILSHSQKCSTFCENIRLKSSIKYQSQDTYCGCISEVLNDLSEKFDHYDNLKQLDTLSTNINKQIKIISALNPNIIPDSIYLPFLSDHSRYLYLTNQLEAAEKQIKEVLKKINLIDPNLASLQFAEIYSLTLQCLSDVASAQSKFKESTQHLLYSIEVEIERANKKKSKPYIGTMQNKIGRNYLQLQDTSLAYEYLQLGNESMKKAIPVIPLSKRRRFFSQFNTHLAFELEAALALNLLPQAERLISLIDLVTFKDLPPILETVLFKARLAHLKDDMSSRERNLIQARTVAYRNESNFDDQLEYHLTLAKYAIESKNYPEALIHIDTMNLVSDKLKNLSSRWSRNMVLARTERLKLLHSLEKHEDFTQELGSFINELQSKLSGTFLFEDHVGFINEFYPIFELGLDRLYAQKGENSMSLAFDIMECTSSLSLFKESQLSRKTGLYSKDSRISDYKIASALSSNLRLRIMNGDTSRSLQKQFYEINEQIKSIKDQMLDQELKKYSLELESYYLNLPSNTRHILVFAGDRHYYFFRINKNKSELLRLRSKEIETLTGDFIESIPELESTKYRKHAQDIGEVLEPILMPAEPGNLIFTGDGLLRLLPLESIVIDDSYLVRHPIDISYAPSARILTNLKDSSEPNDVKVAIFQPSFTDKLTLEYAQNEAEAIQKKLDADKYTGINATKEKFMDISDNYDLIHLATHAKSYSNNSFRSHINFSNQPLYFDEIRSLILRAELVFMAACETNIGKNYTGEGVQSLARNFIASGANSVVSSMWKIPDQTTSEITVSFYKYLKKGKSKSKALKLAKQDFLKAHPHEGSHPYYWAGLVLTGSDQALYPDYSWMIWAGSLAATLLLALLLFYKFRNP